jgi:hypothetical protein
MQTRALPSSTRWRRFRSHPITQTRCGPSDEIVRHYARELKNPSVLIQCGARLRQKSFTLTDGTKAVDLLCSKYAAEKK